MAALTRPGRGHSDGAAEATLVEIGTPAEGIIDNGMDHDYFRFHADEGRSYQIDVRPGTLPAATVTLYDSDGNDLGWGEGVKGSPALSRIIWEAPLSGEKYLEVLGADEGTGAYTLVIIPVPRP